MRGKGRSYVLWCGLVVVFLLALFPRLFYPASRYDLWYNRSVRFWDALLMGDLSGTYQQYHPGVTTMWIAGFGLRVYMAAQGWSSDELLHPPAESGPQGRPAQTGVAALSLVIAASIALVYVLLVRLTNWPVAFSGGCLLALDPFYITHSKLIHVDGLLASFMLVSALFLIGYLQKGSRAYVVFSGVFAGLALLTKSPALFLIPYAALVTVVHCLTDRRDVSVGSFEVSTWSRRLWEVICSLGVWGLVAACVFFLLWPAMWTEPVEVVSRMVEAALFHTETPHPKPSFFAGRVVHSDPGLLYYMATLAWKTTLVTLPATWGAVLFLFRRWKCGEDCRPGWYTLIYGGGFLLMMTLAAKKGLRYVLPAFPALDVLAAWGLVQVASGVGRLGRLRERGWVPVTIVVAALFTQAVTVLRHHPYYGTHHNLLLGGSRVARHVLPLGEQGEGLDLAARFLSGYPGAEWMTIGLQDKDNQMFHRSFIGSVRSIKQPDVDYWVFAVNSNQRKKKVHLWGDLWEACQQMEPLWSISFDGVPYVWIYRAYPHDPQELAIDRRLDAQLGDHIRLLGYRLNSSAIRAGDALTVTLFWQLDGWLVEDYHVFVHLLGGEGSLVAQHDGVPVEGERPTWGWRDAEVLEDEHTLVTDAGLSGGTYTLSVGMYDYLTGGRLPMAGTGGERLSENRVVLQDVRVTLP